MLLYYLTRNLIFACPSLSWQWKQLELLWPFLQLCLKPSDSLFFLLTHSSITTLFSLQFSLLPLLSPSVYFSSTSVSASLFLNFAWKPFLSPSLNLPTPLRSPFSPSAPRPLFPIHLCLCHFFTTSSTVPALSLLLCCHSFFLLFFLILHLPPTSSPSPGSVSQELHYLGLNKAWHC